MSKSNVTVCMLNHISKHAHKKKFSKMIGKRYQPVTKSAYFHNPVTKFGHAVQDGIGSQHLK